jgi:hypothetical protein
MRLDGFTLSWFAIGIITAVLVNSLLWDMPNRPGLVSGPWPLKP